MLASPALNQDVVIWYNKQAAGFMPYHGKQGRVVVSSRGKPRNHLIEIEGQFVVVPCGNLKPDNIKISNDNR